MILHNIFLTWQTFQETNLTGIDGMIQFVAQSWAGFTPLFLFSVFLILLMGTFFAQKRQTGSGDIIASFAASSFVTTLIAFVLTLKDGLINLPILAICVVITILSVSLLILSPDRF